MDDDEWEDSSQNLLEHLHSFVGGDAWDQMDLREDAYHKGYEAWLALLKKYEPKNQIGASTVSSQLQRVEQPTRINETPAMLTRYR